jgi:hypothetical protein
MTKTNQLLIEEIDTKLNKNANKKVHLRQLLIKITPSKKLFD